MLRNLLKPVLRALTRLLFRVEVKGGIPRVPERLLVVANHESFLDGLLLGLFLPLDPVFVVHTGVARNLWFRTMLSLVDYLAVDPTSPMAMKKVIRLIQSGRPVVIFPEGRITTTGSLMKTYDGPAFVAARTGATVLPTARRGPTSPGCPVAFRAGPCRGSPSPSCPSPPCPCRRHPRHGSAAARPARACAG